MDTTSQALKWHTVAEAAQLTGTGKRTLWRRVAEGEMPSKMEGGRRLIGLKPSDMSNAATSLASAAVAAAGAFRAADGMIDALKVVEAQAAVSVAQAREQAREAQSRCLKLEAALSRWRVAAVAVPAGIAVALLALKDPAQAPANVSQSSQAAQHDIEVDVPVVPLWHPPMALPESTEQAPQVVLHQRR